MSPTDKWFIREVVRYRNSRYARAVTPAAAPEERVAVGVPVAVASPIARVSMIPFFRRTRGRLDPRTRSPDGATAGPRPAVAPRSGSARSIESLARAALSLALLGGV